MWGVLGVTVVEHRRPPTRSKLALWAWIALGLIPVGLILGVLEAFAAEGTGGRLGLVPALLILAAPTAAFILAVAAARAGQRSGTAAVVVAGVLLVAALVLLLAGGISFGIQWITVLAMVIATLALFEWRARTTRVTAGTRRPPDRRHRMVRYLAAGLLAIAGIIAALIWTSAAGRAYAHYIDGLPRANIPGQVALHASHPGTYYVYAEGSLARAAVRVTSPAGRAVPVTATSGGGSYDYGGMLGNHPIGEFNATRAGTYRVAAAWGEGAFTVSENVPNWLRPHEWGMAALLVVTVGTGIVLVATTIPQRQDHATSASDGHDRQSPLD